jgi:hypothetical protein
MKIIAPTNQHQVYAEWLKRELYRVKPILPPDQVSMIENPNLKSVEENRKREAMLLHEYKRSNILEELPTQLVWYEATIGGEDLEKLFLLPVWDWFLDSGQTFQLINVPSHLSPKRGHRLRRMPNHHQKIEMMPFSINNNMFALIMIASKPNGLYTIIEGTHCAVKLFMINKLIGTRCFLGLTDDLSKCYWSIERTDLQTHLESLKQMVDFGLMW